MKCAKILQRKIKNFLFEKKILFKFAIQACDFKYNIYIY